MSGSRRPPTDQQRTAVYDPEARDARDARGAFAPARQAVEIGTPTEIDPNAGSAAHRAAAADGRPQPARGPEQSEPIRVISLKAPGDAAAERPERAPKQHQVQLRQLSDLPPHRRHAATPPGGLGYLAPPRDPRQARTRRLRDTLLWGSVAVIVAGAVTVGVWFLAGS